MGSLKYSDKGKIGLATIQNCDISLATELALVSTSYAEKKNLKSLTVWKAVGAHLLTLDLAKQRNGKLTSYLTR